MAQKRVNKVFKAIKFTGTNSGSVSQRSQQLDQQVVNREIAAQLHLIAELGSNVSDKNHRENLLYLKAVDERDELLNLVKSKKLSHSTSMPAMFNAVDGIGSGISNQGEY